MTNQSLYVDVQRLSAKPVTKLCLLLVVLILFLLSLQSTGPDGNVPINPPPDLYIPQTDIRNITYPFGPLTPKELKRMEANGLDPNKLAINFEMMDRAQALPVLLHFISVLDDDWTFRIYHCEAIGQRLASPLLDKHIASGKVTLIPLNIQFVNHEAVSLIFTEKHFWEHMAPAEMILMFQFDSILCSQSDLKVEDFFPYEFIGAPINQAIVQSPTLIMNGGLSLRHRSSMLRVIETYGGVSDVGMQFEDQFFCKYLHELNATLPSVDTAMTFSVETMYYSQPLGIHQATRFLRHGGGGDNPEGLLDLQTKHCPEMNMLTNSRQG